jgi:septal ring factor EnvC (AmiA/AmiB activator)
MPAVPDDDLDAESIGEQIDRAIGDFEAKLARLKEELKQKRSEVKQVERDIARVEKDQAKAFKDLLGANPRIKKMLGRKSRSKPTSRRKKTTTTDRGGEPDNEPLL